jgi:DNA primase
MDDAAGEPVGQRISLLEYLEQHGWKPARTGAGEEVAGLCPLHRETRPSFYVNRRKQLFYCHGCGRGGDVIRLIELVEGISFRQALARVRAWRPAQGMLEETFGFYQAQLARYAEANQYLALRGIHAPEIVARLRIGYAPGACLRAHLEGLGHETAEMRRLGLIDDRGRDRFWRCLTFPLEETGSLYGRSIDPGHTPRHRFLPRPKGGLYGWRQARGHSSLILVEGLLDLAALWQAGFAQTVAALGAHLNSRQLGELGDGPAGAIYLCLDADANLAGARAALHLAGKLRAAGIDARRVALPFGHDPNSFFAAGGTATEFQRFLDEARP